jgi:DNA adenine methylase
MKLAPEPTPHGAPIIKWAGGKTKLLPELVARMPSRFGRYFEPFAGGAALFFYVQPERAVLSDANEDLMRMYRAIARTPEAVIRRLKRHATKHARDERGHYEATRARWNRDAHNGRHAWTLADVAATFIYLNKTCFNGLWRVNQSGEFNVPIGRYASPAIYRPDAIRAASVALSDVTFRPYSYKASVWDAARGDFVYLDPPYDPVTPTANFTGYTREAFGREQQMELADLAYKLADRGCHVMLSNHDTRFIRRLYSGFHIARVMCPRAINSDAGRRGAVRELIITSYPPPKRRRAR